MITRFDEKVNTIYSNHFKLATEVHYQFQIIEAKTVETLSRVLAELPNPIHTVEYIGAIIILIFFRSANVDLSFSMKNGKSY